MVYHISLQLWELAQLVLRGVGVLESTASAVSLVETAKSELTTSRNRAAVFLLAAFRRAVRSRGPPTTNTDRHHHPSNPPAAPQQQTNNSLNFKQLLHKAAASQQHVADTNWQLTRTHTLCRESNFLYTA